MLAIKLIQITFMMFPAQVVLFLVCNLLLYVAYLANSSLKYELKLIL